MLHLDEIQQSQLKEVLLKYDKLLDGVLKKFPGQPMHVELLPKAVPVCRRPHPVPQVHVATFKKELDYTVQIGVLSPVRDTK